MKPLTQYLSGVQLRGHRQTLADHPLWRDRISAATVGAIVLFTIGTILTLVFRLKHVDYPVPTHYDSLIGFDITGPWYANYRIGLFALMVAIVNIGLALRSFRRNRLASFLLLLGAATVTLFCWIITAAFTGAV